MATTSNPPTLPPPGDGYRIHPKQREALASDARYKILKWGRRAGKNAIAAIETIEFLRDPSQCRWGRDDPHDQSDDQPITVWWISRSYDQAEKYGFEKVKAALPASYIEDQSRTEPYRIELRNGAVVEFRTYDHPETLQGAGVDGIVVDERDYMSDTVWHDDLDPMLLDFEGWALWISKPVHSRSLFSQWFSLGQHDEHPEFFSSHATSSDNPFIDEDPSDKEGTVPDHVYQQQYLAQLPDDGGQIFSELDDRLFTADYELPADPADAEPPFATGVDFARHQDHRVIVTLDAMGDLVYFDRDQHEAWPQIQDAVEDAADTYEGIVAVDASRDNKIVADLEAAGVTVEPVTFSPQRKTELIEDLTASIESGELSSPEIPQLRHELEVFEYDVTSAGNVRYHAPSGFHDDVVDALALAVAADRCSGSDDDRLQSVPWR